MFFMDNLSVSNAQKVKKGGKTWTFSAQMPSTRDRTVMVQKVEKLRMRVLFRSSGDGVDP